LFSAIVRASVRECRSAVCADPTTAENRTSNPALEITLFKANLGYYDFEMLDLETTGGKSYEAIGGRKIQRAGVDGVSKAKATVACC